MNQPKADIPWGLYALAGAILIGAADIAHSLPTEAYRSRGGGLSLLGFFVLIGVVLIHITAVRTRIWQGLGSWLARKWKGRGEIEEDQ